MNIGQDTFIASCKHDKIFNRTDFVLVYNVSENHEGHNTCCTDPNYVEILLILRLNYDIIYCAKNWAGAVSDN